MSSESLLQVSTDHKSGEESKAADLSGIEMSPPKPESRTQDATTTSNQTTSGQQLRSPAAPSTVIPSSGVESKPPTATAPTIAASPQRTGTKVSPALLASSTILKKRKAPASSAPHASSQLVHLHPPLPHASFHHHHMPHPSVAHQLLVDSAMIQQTTRDVIALLQLYGPLTAGQIEYNIPPIVLSTTSTNNANLYVVPPPTLPISVAPSSAANLSSNAMPSAPISTANHPMPPPPGAGALPPPPKHPQGMVMAASSGRSSSNASSSSVLQDILQILVAVGLVQTVVPPRTTVKGNQSDPSSSVYTGGTPSRTWAPTTRFCMARGIPRADVVLPTTVWDEIQTAHEETKRSWERRNRLAAALVSYASQPPAPSDRVPSNSEPTIATTKSSSSSSSSLSPSSAAPLHPKQLLQKVLDDYPEILHDPVYVTALRNLHVDADQRTHASGKHGRGSGSGAKTKKKKKKDVAAVAPSSSTITGDTNATAKSTGIKKPKTKPAAKSTTVMLSNETTDASIGAAPAVSASISLPVSNDPGPAQPVAANPSTNPTPTPVAALSGPNNVTVTKDELNDSPQIIKSTNTPTSSARENTNG